MKDENCFFPFEMGTHIDRVDKDIDNFLGNFLSTYLVLNGPVLPSKYIKIYYPVLYIEICCNYRHELSHNETWNFCFEYFRDSYTPNMSDKELQEIFKAIYEGAKEINLTIKPEFFDRLRDFKSYIEDKISNKEVIFKFIMEYVEQQPYLENVHEKYKKLYNDKKNC